MVVGHHESAAAVQVLRGVTGHLVAGGPGVGRAVRVGFQQYHAVPGIAGEVQQVLGDRGRERRDQGLLARGRPPWPWATAQAALSSRLSGSFPIPPSLPR